MLVSGRVVAEFQLRGESSDQAGGIIGIPGVNVDARMSENAEKALTHLAELTVNRQKQFRRIVARCEEQP